MQDTLPITAESDEISFCAACPACGSAQSKVFFELPSIPVNSITLWPTRNEALQCPTGTIQLAFCAECGAIYNRAFDPAVLQYDTRYDNSLHFSPSFQQYAEALADQLIARFNLRDKDLVEIGCGKGEFLALLCERGGNRGLGFDPTYERGRVDVQAGQGFRVIPDFYSRAYTHEAADFVCCRHVLEHVFEPRSFLGNIRQGISDRPGCGVFFEVPNALFTLCHMGIWDVIYEHCFYYTAAPLARLFASSGFDVLKTYEAFGGQYLCLEAKPAATDGNASHSLKEGDLSALSSAVNAFARRYQQQIGQWRRALKDLAQEGKRVVLWGAGAKGAMFLNAFRDVSNVQYIVDINPHKHGSFVPGTGQQVVAPDFLGEYKPDLIIITNPNYGEEIKRTVANLGVNAQFRLV